MSTDGYSVEVTGLSPKVTEKDLRDFFSFSGAILHVEIIRFTSVDRSGDACTGYVTFKDAYSQETAVLLSAAPNLLSGPSTCCYSQFVNQSRGTSNKECSSEGATIVDQRVCITRWGQCEDEFSFWNRSSSRHEDESNSTNPIGSQYMPNPGEIATMAQDVVKTMLSKGYTLGKDALTKAKDFDESHQVSTTAMAKVAELTERIGLADKICAGVEAAKSVDEKYHVTEYTRSAVLATGRTAAAAANTVVNSSYFSRGALWVSDALNRAANAAADLGSHGARQ